MPHQLYKNNSISGRYLSYESLRKCLVDFENFKIDSMEGISVLGQKIPVYKFGKGQTKILLWSQMHGNESTTTKALLDVFNFLTSSHEVAKVLLSSLQFMIIPMLNPDGANAYTRVNANGVDINRDFVALSQPESQFLVSVFEKCQPQFCFNLHDQRTIFSVGDTSLPATLSFLGPAADAQRTVTPSRRISMQLIAAINKQLQNYIPGQLGRYDDTYNENCAGDHFQSQGVPTLLFEAGHTGTDYQREETRTWVYESLLASFKAINDQSYLSFNEQDYLEIPENQKNHLDVKILNAVFVNPKIDKNTSLACQYEERLELGEITFIPKIITLETDSLNYFHNTVDFSIDTPSDQAIVNQSIRDKLKTLGV